MSLQQASPINEDDDWRERFHDYAKHTGYMPGQNIIGNSLNLAVKELGEY